MPPAKKVFKCNGYLSNGELYKEINDERNKKSLHSIFGGIA
jgi:hypothetical protein